jgi:hypothetical protein
MISIFAPCCTQTCIACGASFTIQHRAGKLLLFFLQSAAVVHLFYIRLLHEALEEVVGVAEAPAADDVTVRDEAVTPIEAKHVLASACSTKQGPAHNQACSGQSLSAVPTCRCE